MDKFLEALKQGAVKLDPEKAVIERRRTTDELRQLITKSKALPRGRKAVLVEVDGEERTLKEWAELFDINYMRLRYFYAKKKLRGRKLIDTARTVKPRKYP